ncbi:MAG TPA: hypothetical protein VHT95_04160, partial [Vicinamibacterales bacterium]|nr:hypothetical protein [Vicinamibacterales bacterium]
GAYEAHATFTQMEPAAHPEAYAAIKRPDGSGKMSNALSIEVGSDQVRFLVNGTEVTSVDATKVDTAGTPGLRVNHNLKPSRRRICGKGQITLGRQRIF